MASARRVATLAGRLAAALLFGLALLAPPLPPTAAVPELRVLQPADVPEPDSGDGRVSLDLRADAVDERLTVTPLGFGAGLPESTLGAALTRTLETLRPDWLGAIVIRSAGWWEPAASALIERGAGAGIPVYWQRTDGDAVGSRITGVQAPAAATAGETIAVVVSARTAPGDEYEIALSAEGRELARAPAARGTPIPLRLPPASADGHRAALAIDAALIRRDDGAVADRWRDAAIVNLVAPPAVLVLADRPSALAASLAAGGWPVTAVRPREAPPLLASLGAFAAVILDDIRADSLPDTAWDALGNAIRRDAVGLLVLGGAHAFAAGGYRDSRLEALLPVISEPPERERPATVVFLVDVSGSMAEDEVAALGIAREAILETAAALRPSDRVGLVAFDVEARSLLAPQPRDDHGAAIRAAFPTRASGGTAAAPALALALSLLGDDDGTQRLMVMVTDGMLSDADQEAIRRASLGERTEIIALVADAGTAAPTTRIALGDGATVIRGGAPLDLPTVMRGEVEARRPAVSSEPARPLARGATPFGADWGDWPAVAAYDVTRPRPETDVHLATADGEPLFAAWTVGAGRVAVLTAGLGGWTPDWLAWERWPALAAGVTGYVAVRNTGQIRVDTELLPDGRARLRVDTGTPQTGEPGRVRVVTPDAIEAPAVATVAPGVYELGVRSGTPGAWTLVWDDERGNVRHGFVVPDPSRPGSDAVSPGESLVAAGVLLPWDADAPPELAAPRPWRRWLTVAALLLFLATLVAERVPLGRIVRGRVTLGGDRA